jgi:probable HAF family extracellular repeat protein
MTASVRWCIVWTEQLQSSTHGEHYEISRRPLGERREFAMMLRPIRILLAMFGALGVSIFSPNASAQEYKLTDLGTLGGTFSYGTAINASGQVTGFSYHEGDCCDEHAFLYSAGLMLDLGTLGGPYSGGQGINASGQVTGYAATPLDFGVNTGYQSFLYSNGTMQGLGTLGGEYSAGNAVNASGLVTGSTQLFDPVFERYSEHAFVYANGSMHDLGTLGGQNSVGYAINTSGQVAGQSDAGAFGITDYQAFLYSNSSMYNLGTLGGPFSTGYGINDSGEVVGQADVTLGTSHAFLYRNGSMHDLGTLGGQNSVAYSINASGRIVGDTAIAPSGMEHGFIYSNGKMIDLNTLVGSNPSAKYVHLNHAGAINDKGWIVASGSDSRTGQEHAYLLTTVTAPVPVPNVVGEVQAAGKNSITAIGLVVGVVTTPRSATVPAGTILSEIPAAGTEVEVGSAVNIAVSSGPATCGDLEMIKAAFGSKVGEPNYNPQADVNKDGVVNIVDLSTVARELPPGTTCK